MHSNARIINKLAELTAQYTEDLRQPFAENSEWNQDAETPFLLIADVCEALGSSIEQTQRVLSETGSAFVAYLNQPIQIFDAPQTINLFNRQIPIAGVIGDDGKVTLNAYGQKYL
jgi:hypothetical protein